MQKSKMAVWGGLTNSCEKKRSKKQRSKAGLEKAMATHSSTLARRTPWTSRNLLQLEVEGWDGKAEGSDSLV